MSDQSPLHFRWNAPPLTKLAVSAVKVIEREQSIRIELYVASARGDEVCAQVIETPFLPRAMHADCMSLEEHAAEVSVAVQNAVISWKERVAVQEVWIEDFQRQYDNNINVTTQLQEKMAALHVEIDKLRRQISVAMSVIDAARPLAETTQPMTTRRLWLQKELAKFDAEGAALEVMTVEHHEHEVTAQVAKAVEKVKVENQSEITHLRTTLEYCARKLVESDTSDYGDLFKKIEVALNG